MQSITPCLWFDGQALEAAEFYTSLFPGSSMGEAHQTKSDTPGGKANSVMLVTFTLAGRTYQALNGGPHYKFNEAISLSVSCDDQVEVDHFWERLTADGGKPGKCGWLKDKYGLSWQIVPKALGQFLGGPDPVKAKRAMHTMLQMSKLDIAALQRAYEDDPS